MKSWFVGISAVVAAALCSASYGETVNMSLASSPSVGLSRSLTITAKVGSSTSVMTSAGAYKWNVTGDSGGSTFSNNLVNSVPLYTFCIQAFQTTGQSTYNVTGLGGNVPVGGRDAGAIDALAAAQIQGLYNKYGASIDYNKSKSAYSFNGTAYTDDQVAAAFQLAIWEIEYDGGAGGEGFGKTTNYFSSGNLKAVKSGSTADGQAAINLANGWLNNFTPDNSIASLALVSGSRSDQFLGIGGSFGTALAAVATPLPMGALGGLALIAGLGVRRKLAKRNEAK